MKRLLVLAGLLGAAAVALARRFGLGKGPAEGAAEMVGEEGPGVTGSVAQGIEEAGEEAERGAQEVRQPVPEAQEEEEQEEARDDGGEPSEAEEAPR